MKDLLLETPSILVGWALVVLLGVMAFMPWGSPVLLTLKGTVLLALIVYVWAMGQASRADKRVHLHISGLKKADQEKLEERLTAQLERIGRIERTRYEDGELTVILATARSLATVKRRIGKARKTGRLVSINATVNYALSDAEAGFEVEVFGHAAPGARVIIPGVDEPIKVDDHGNFRTKVPYDIIRKHDSKGFIPAHWERGETKEKLKIRIPA